MLTLLLFSLNLNVLQELVESHAVRAAGRRLLYSSTVTSLLSTGMLTLVVLKDKIVVIGPALLVDIPGCLLMSINNTAYNKHDITIDFNRLSRSIAEFFSADDAVFLHPCTCTPTARKCRKSRERFSLFSTRLTDRRQTDGQTDVTSLATKLLLFLCRTRTACLYYTVWSGVPCR